MNGDPVVCVTFGHRDLGEREDATAGRRWISDERSMRRARPRRRGRETGAIRSTARGRRAGATAAASRVAATSIASRTSRTRTIDRERARATPRRRARASTTTTAEGTEA